MGTLSWRQLQGGMDHYEMVGSRLRTRRRLELARGPAGWQLTIDGQHRGEPSPTFRDATRLATEIAVANGWLEQTDTERRRSRGMLLQQRLL